MTGGAGFIGSAVMRELAARGDEGVSLDRADGVDVLLEPLPEADAFIHLAGVLGTAELFADPLRAVDMNVKTTVRVLQQCAQVGARYVGISMPQIWSNVYQATKNCSRQLAAAWHENFGVPVAHVVAYNVYGHGQKVQGVQKAVPTFATRAWRNEPIPVWGTGEQRVDLVFVDDVARMLVDAISHGEADDPVFDAGTGVAMTVNDLVGLIVDYTGSESKPEHLPMRHGERFSTVRPPVARGAGWDMLGWHPQPRPGMLCRTVDWYRKDRP